MACWGGARDGNLASALARIHERGVAGILGTRVSLIERGLWSVLRRDRLARHVVDRHLAGVLGDLRALLREGAESLAGEPPIAKIAEPRGARAALQYLQRQHAAQHPDCMLVDGERVCRLLLDLRVVCHASAEGSALDCGPG